MATIAIDAKPKAISFLTVLAIALGWGIMMALAFTVFGILKAESLPVSISPFKDFYSQMWDGSFHAQGSFKNKSAKTDGERLLLQTNDITCRKSDMTCIIATSSVHNGFMNLDVSPYTIDIWDKDTIRFSDDSAICVHTDYAIYRATNDVRMTVRPKSTIPDYARNSPLHPCDGINTMDVELVAGSETYNDRVAAFDRTHKTYFDFSLGFLNLAFFFVVREILRRKQALALARAGAAT